MPLQAAECGYFNESHGTELTFDEKADPQLLTISGDRSLSCRLEPDLDGDEIWTLNCQDQPRSLTFIDEEGSPSVFVVDGEEFRWFCPAENGVELQPAFNVDVGE